ncbi:MAG: NPCBM/NEW2 domain-containing protein [Planctomycetes bacterium]|nr:NPCBM/NEW2 domain-containing protein [Planctomycetota bacterium]
MKPVIGKLSAFLIASTFAFSFRAIAAETVILVDETSYKGEIQNITATTITIKKENDEVIEIPRAKVIEISFPGEVVANSSSMALGLRDGEQFVGEIQPSGNGDGFVFVDRSRLRLDVTEDIFGAVMQIDNQRNKAQTPPLERTDRDTIFYFENGALEFDAGYIYSIDNEVVTYESHIWNEPGEGDHLRIALSQVIRIVMSDDSGFEFDADENTESVYTKYGSILKGKVVSMENRTIAIENQVFGRLELNLRDVVSIRSKNDLVTYVSDIEPSSVLEHGALRMRGDQTTFFPFRTNLDFAGGVPAIRGRRYLNSLVCHVYSKLEFDVPGDAIEFVSYVGVSDETLNLSPDYTAKMVFRVYVDGEKKFDSGVLIENSAATLVKLSVRGQQKLALELTWADDGDPISYYIKGRGVWGDARFIASEE